LIVVVTPEILHGLSMALHIFVVAFNFTTTKKILDHYLMAVAA